MKERMVGDMKAALKEREEGKRRVSTIRLALAAVKNAEIDKRRELTDEEICEILRREIRQRQEAIPDYERGKRRDLVDKMQEEMGILAGYLPAAMSEEEVRRVVTEGIAAVGASGPKDLGKVMGFVMARVRGRADGRFVNEIAREMLE